MGTRWVGAVFNCAEMVRLQTAPTGGVNRTGKRESGRTGKEGGKEEGEGLSVGTRWVGAVFNCAEMVRLQTAPTGGRQQNGKTGKPENEKTGKEGKGRGYRWEPVG